MAQTTMAIVKPTKIMTVQVPTTSCSDVKLGVGVGGSSAMTTVTVGDGVGEGGAVADGDGVGDGVTVGDPVGVAVAGAMVGVAKGVGVPSGVACTAVGVAGDGDAAGVLDGTGDASGVMDAVGDVTGDAVAVTVPVAVITSVADGDTVDVAGTSVPDGVGEPVACACGIVRSPKRPIDGDGAARHAAVHSAESTMHRM